MLNINDKFLELSERSNRLFAITKRQMKKYTCERKKLLSFSEDKNVNYKEWEEYIEFFEQKVYEENFLGH